MAGAGADPSGVRALVVAGLSVVLAVLLVRQVVMRRLAPVSIALVAVLVLALGAMEWRWVLSVHRLSDAVRVTAPASQGVTCQRFIGTFGYAGAEWGHVDREPTGVAAPTAFLSYDACALAFAYLRSDKSAPPVEQVMAVHTLTHEAVHLRGEWSESVAECESMQRDRATAVSLGATPAQAEALARTYVVEVYPRVPAEYADARCREGGAWDRSPGDGLWP